MPTTRKKAIALLTTAAGLGILLAAGVVLYRPLEECYWLWRLEAGTEDDGNVASQELAKLRSVRALPDLMAAAAACAGSRHWVIRRGTSELMFQAWTSYSPWTASNGPMHYVEAIRDISEGAPENLLRPYLMDDREFVRAIAASTLFHGTPGALKC